MRGRGGMVDWMASHHPPLFGEVKQKALKKTVNIMAEIKANALDNYLIVISALWNLLVFLE